MSVYWFLLPAAALLALFLGAPLVLVLVAAAGDFELLRHDPLLSGVLATSVLFAAISVAVELALGIASALVLDGLRRGRGIATAFALLPWALPTAVMAMSWRWIFNDTYGIANRVALDAGLLDQPVAWLGGPATAFAAVVAADVWKSTPFVTIIVLAGLQAIPRELHEAMSLDGAGPVRRFFWLTLPLLRPAIALALTFRTIQAMGVFDLVWVMTGGGPGNATRPVALYIYDNVFRYLSHGYAAALTVCVAGLLLVAALAAARAAKHEAPA